MRFSFPMIRLDEGGFYMILFSLRASKTSRFIYFMLK